MEKHSFGRTLSPRNLPQLAAGGTAMSYKPAPQPQPSSREGKLCVRKVGLFLLLSNYWYSANRAGQISGELSVSTLRWVVAGEMACQSQIKRWVLLRYEAWTPRVRGDSSERNSGYDLCVIYFWATVFISTTLRAELHWESCSKASATAVKRHRAVPEKSQHSFADKAEGWRTVFWDGYASTWPWGRREGQHWETTSGAREQAAGMGCTTRCKEQRDCIPRR